MRRRRRFARSVSPPPKYNVCGVLAGCYKGKRSNLKDMLTHYEVPGTNDALCGRVQEGGLCDVTLPGPPTCQHCVRKAARQSRARRPPTSPGTLFARDTSGERFALAPSSADEADLPGMAEWRARQKKKAEADLLRAELESLRGRRGT